MGECAVFVLSGIVCALCLWKLRFKEEFVVFIWFGRLEWDDRKMKLLKFWTSSWEVIWGMGFIFGLKTDTKFKEESEYMD